MTALILAAVACVGTLATGFMTLRGVLDSNRTRAKADAAVASAAMHAASVQEKDAAMDAVLAVAKEWQAYALAQQSTLGAEVQRLREKVDLLDDGLQQARRMEAECRRELVIANARISALGG